MEFITRYLPDLAGGLGTSLKIAAVSTIAGLILGLVLAVLSASANRFVRIGTVVVIEIGRGIPVLVMLQLVYFGLPSTGVVLQPMVAAWIALAAITACYSSEIIRSGFISISRGQLEAARDLGLSKHTILLHIVLPQALRVSAAPLAGLAIQMFQATSLTFALSIPELLSQAYDIGSLTFRYLDILGLAGFMYAIIGIPLLYGVNALERRMGPRGERGRSRTALLAKV